MLEKKQIQNEIKRLQKEVSKLKSLLRKEKWKILPFFEEAYIISNWGRVRGLDRFCLTKNGATRFVPGKILTPKIDKYGYVVYKLSLNGKKFFITAHRLVAMTWIPNPNKKPQINHITGNKLLNIPERLEWCTGAQNIEHAKVTGLLNKDRKNIQSRKPVLQYSMGGIFIREWDFVEQAAKNYNIGGENITRVCKGKRPSTAGFYWRYKN